MAIKLGASSYSYQDEFYRGEMNLEDCVASLAKCGGTGFELILEQMLPGDNFLRLSDKFIGEWFDMMAKYNMEPTCADIFDDYNLFKNRTLTVREQLDMMDHYLSVAKKLGFSSVRVLCLTPFEVLEEMIPMGEYYDIKLGLEIHAPLSMKSDWALKWREMIAKKSTKHAGFIPDFGIFSLRPYTVSVQRAIRQGGKPEILDYIVEAYKKNAAERVKKAEIRQNADPESSLFKGAEGMEEIIEEVKRMGGGEAEIAVASSRYSYDDPAWMIEVLPLIVHTHAKFYDMQEDGKGGYTDPNIDTENVVRILRDNGYDGYLSSEYEGHGYFRDPGCTEVPSGPEQVRRHHEMMRAVLNEK